MSTAGIVSGQGRELLVRTVRFRISKFGRSMARPNLGKLLAAKAGRVSQAAKLTLNSPARTRFAPSPTGLIHLGSLRTALYNYLLAKATKGQFILRLEDTDQSRIKPGAEENIYKSLQWAKIIWDEGPIKQSERKAIYAKYAQTLLEKGKAYRCFCSKERLDSLAESARQMKPPTTASYDRKCSHITADDSLKMAQDGSPHVLRFKAPKVWPKIEDLLHGSVECLTQTNQADPRFDDFVIIKSDGMPTYHFANVVDDFLMNITHVIRGEEWLPSTPKHVALYDALKLQPPQFVHIPLLTGEGGKKLSKRRSDQGIFELANEPDFISPEALVNFVALLGWSSVAHSHATIGQSVNEVKSMSDLEREFCLDGLTKGNIQVDFNKLHYLNKQHFEKLLNLNFNEAAKRCQAAFPEFDLDKTKKTLHILKSHVSCVADYVSHVRTVTANPRYLKPPKDLEFTRTVASFALELLKKPISSYQDLVIEIVNHHSKKANMALRYALLDGSTGISIVEAVTLLGAEETANRLNECYKHLEYCT